MFRLAEHYSVHFIGISFELHHGYFELHVKLHKKVNLQHLQYPTVLY